MARGGEPRPRWWAAVMLVLFLAAVMQQPSLVPDPNRPAPVPTLPWAVGRECG